MQFSRKYIFSLCLLLVFTPFALGQQWNKIAIPEGIEYLKMTGNITVSGSLALWGTEQPYTDSTRTIIITPWKFYTTQDGGNSWTVIDSSTFSTLFISELRFMSNWYAMTYLGSSMTRTTVETGSPDILNYFFERREGASDFVQTPYPFQTGRYSASPLLYPAEGGLLYNLRYRTDDNPDSTLISVYRTAGPETDWKIIPDSANGYHRIPSPTVLGFRTNFQNTMYLGTVVGLYKTANNGSSWRQVISQTELDISSINLLAVHPRNASVILANGRRKAGDGLDHLYCSTDIGINWSEVFSDTLITGIALSYSDPAKILISTLSGLYATGDFGATWFDALGNLPKPYGINSIQSVHIDPGNNARAYVAFAQSAYISEDWLTSIESPESYAKDFEMEAFPNPVSAEGKLVVRIFSPNRAFLSLKLYDLLGREQGSIVEQEIAEGINHVDFCPSAYLGGSIGNYFLVAKTQTGIRSNKIVITNR